MGKYRIIKIVTAKDFVTALSKEHKFQPVEVTLLEAEEKPAKVPQDLANAIGFSYQTDEDDNDSDGGE